MSAEAEGRFSRTELLYGSEAVKALGRARVAVFGIGGVGGYVVEALARSGVGSLDLVDHDKVALSNLNRQIIATEPTLGQDKVNAAKERVLSINPGCAVSVHRLFFLPETAGEIDFSVFDYVADAVDNKTLRVGDLLSGGDGGAAGGGHIAMCVGIDSEGYIYVAEELGYRTHWGFMIRKYTRDELLYYFYWRVDMDEFYGEDGNLTNYWIEE